MLGACSLLENRDLTTLVKTSLYGKKRQYSLQGCFLKMLVMGYVTILHNDVFFYDVFIIVALLATQ